MFENGFRSSGVNNEQSPTGIYPERIPLIKCFPLHFCKWFEVSSLVLCCDVILFSLKIKITLRFKVAEYLVGEMSTFYAKQQTIICKTFFAGLNCKSSAFPRNGLLKKE